MNLIDLPDMMRARTDHEPAPILAESRLAGVQRRVASAHRRRVTGALAGIVVIVVVTFGLPFAQRFADRTADSPGSTHAVKMINGYPEYTLGGHLIGTKTASLRSVISFTVTPTDLGFIFANMCTVVDPTIEIDIQITVGTDMRMGSGCTPGGGGYASFDPVASDHVVPGKPTEVTFVPTAYRVTMDSQGEQSSRKPMAMPSGTYSVAMWQKLPFAAYPLPPRPKKLTALDPQGYGLAGKGTKQTVYSDPANPLAPRSITFTMGDCGADPINCNPTATTSQTPGLLHISVNGVEINTAEFWDYSGGSSGVDITPEMANLSLKPGELVTVTITPEYVTGAWVFAILPTP